MKIIAIVTARLTSKRLPGKTLKPILGIPMIELLNIISKPSSNWSFIANELLASYYLKKNDLDSAKQSLNYIMESKDSSDFIKERARTILEMIERKE